MPEILPSAAALAARPYRPQQAPANALRLDCTEGLLHTATLRQTLGLLDDQAWLRYPDARQLEVLLAQRWKIKPQNVLVTAGADEALDRVCRAYLCPGRKALVTRPTFEMIPHWIKLAGAELVEIPWFRGRFPLARMLWVTDRKTTVVFAVTPNNPTGAVASAEEIGRLARSVPFCLVVVDAAYAEFSEDDPTQQLLGFSNLVVIRSLSKAWSLAGLRVGYVLGAAEIIERLRAVGGPYSVSRLSLALAAKRLESDAEATKRYVVEVRRQRKKLEQLLQRLGAKPLSSQANFVLCRFRRARFLSRALSALGIQVRDFPGRPQLEGYLRITCPGREREFALLCKALESVLSPQALLFDMDGVLADVSASYHQAAVETARAFGVEISARQMRRAKLEAGSNNDWVVTERLLMRAGKRVSLEKVIRCFENIYNGSDEQPGLWMKERAIFPRQILERLGRAFRLGLVTGRPRQQALRFLEKEGLRDLFATLVCREDAPPKPSPKPVQLALKKLGVKSAWLIGDTPDDMVAAKKAGVVSIGFCGSGKESRAALLRAGAAAVIADPSALEDLLGAIFKGGES